MNLRLLSQTAAWEGGKGEPGSVEIAKTYCNLNEQSTIYLIKVDLNKLAGVYAFKYATTGKMYIGSSANLWKRFNEHLKNKSSNIHLQRAFEKHGLEQFSFNILEFCSNDLNLSKEEF